MTIRRSNPRLQGLIGLGAAIDWFTRSGFVVSLPLNDSQSYDLIADEPGGKLLRVQVKTTTARNPAGTFVVSLQTGGGNQSFHTHKPFDHSTSDLLFVLTDDGDIYVIPCDDFSNQRQLALHKAYDRYRQGR